MIVFHYKLSTHYTIAILRLSIVSTHLYNIIDTHISRHVVFILRIFRVQLITMIIIIITTSSTPSRCNYTTIIVIKQSN